jgi:hypothetical protein
MEPQNDKQSSSEDAVIYVRRREFANRMTEMYIWMIAALVVAGGVFFDILGRRGPPIEVVSDRYFEVLLATLTFFFPWVFRLIFGALPLESIRRKRALRELESPRAAREETPDAGLREAEIRVLSDAMSTEDLAASPATKLFAYYASSSRRLSQSIYSRAGVYLLVGVVVAFSGLAFFYSQTAQLGAVSLDGIPLLITLAPKFGILFFIELVAFFFLRQYRSAMDEFRYYEAIKRKREETLALIRIATDGGKEFDPIDLVKNESFFSRAGALEKDQSTEIIESRKLEKNELDILEKVIDVVLRSKE